ncbi:MAG: hypothetical protein ACPGAP_07140 [Akkermansiaceae bacterium]
MKKEGVDPYEIPAEATELPEPVQRFAAWNTPVLLAVFFIPAAFFLFAFCSSRYLGNRSLEELALYFALGSGVIISLVSAGIHSLREGERLGIFALLTFVHLLAQFLVFMTLRIGAEILVTL